MLRVPRKKTGRPPGRPRVGHESRAKDDETRTLYIDVSGALWNRIQDALDRARDRTGFNVAKAELVKKLLERALEADEADTK